MSAYPVYLQGHRPRRLERGRRRGRRRGGCDAGRRARSGGGAGGRGAQRRPKDLSATIPRRSAAVASKTSPSQTGSTVRAEKGGFGRLADEMRCGGFGGLAGSRGGEGLRAHPQEGASRAEGSSPVGGWLASGPRRRWEDGSPAGGKKRGGPP